MDHLEVTSKGRVTGYMPERRDWNDRSSIRDNESGLHIWASNTQTVVITVKNDWNSLHRIPIQVKILNEI